MVNGHRENLDDSMLDRALEAAFGAAADGGATAAGGVSVLARIEQRHGVKTRIVLRDADDETAEAVVLPPSLASADDTDPASDRYQVFGEMARGGMGVIYRGRDADLGREVAIKVLQPALAKQPAMVQRFVEEAQIAGQLQHPGILPVYELGLQEDARPFFSMKLIKGRTLADRLEQRRDPADDRAALLKIFEQVCQTIAYAHARGVVHRDLKPSNIMVGAFGEVQVVDWGLAKVLGQGRGEIAHDDAPPQPTRIETVRTERPGAASMAGAVMGTPGYMSPEQARGEVGEIDERADVYALGAMLYEILTGSPPVRRPRATPPSGAAAEPLDAEAIRGGLERADADADLIDLACSCLAARRRDRPRNAKQVADLVNQHLASLEARARQADVRAAEERTRAEAERHRRKLTLALAVIIVAALVMISLGAGWAYVSNQRQQEQMMAGLASAVSKSSQLLGSAMAARLDNDDAWDAVELAAVQVRDLLEQVPAESELAVRARALLEEIDARTRQRRLGATVENVVIYAATHYDAESWRRMERDLRAALLEFGIDLDTMAKDEIARRIREDEATFELADGLELWLGTMGSLVEMGAIQMEFADFRAWLDTLLAADPDPLRQRVRHLVYAAILQEPVDREEVKRLFESLDFERVHPRTLSWLATVYYVVGDTPAMVEVLRRITDAHPADFMLMFDAGFSCAQLQQWAPAVRYYLRCLAIRPDVGGIWRQLGVAYRHTGELAASLDALNRSIELEPEHGPTHIDLAETRLALGDAETAIADARRGLELSAASDAPGWFVIGKARFAQERYGEALEALERAAAAAVGDKRFNEPVEEWIERCRAAPRGGG